MRTVLQVVAVCVARRRRDAVGCNVLQRVAACCDVLQRLAMCCKVLQCVARRPITRRGYAAGGAQSLVKILISHKS